MKTQIESFAHYKTVPFQHQITGIDALVKNEAFALFDEMGVGKSYQVVNAACELAALGKIDTVVIVAPASVRCVWLDKEIGEIKKHSWRPSIVYEFHQKVRSVWNDTPSIIVDNFPPIHWIVTNYEFLRNEKHLAELCVKLLDRKVMLVLDESSYVKSRTAAQTKATLKLRKHCDRCVLLNGTPVTNSPLDLWSQMQILSPEILEKNFKNFYHFRSKYCKTIPLRFAGHTFQQVVRYRRLDALAERIAPWVLRREKKDCLDLPEKLYTQREVSLSPESWKRYSELKSDALISLEGAGEKRMEPNAAVRLMRLAQLTSGILGRQNAAFGDCITDDLSDEKLKWAIQYLTEECTAKAVIVWTRWRRERERLVEALNEIIKQNKSRIVQIVQIYGGQKQEDRNSAITLFSGKFVSDHCAVCVAQPHAGGHGLNLVAASEAIYLSNDFALWIRLQSEDRCHRPGQINPVTYIDVLATGPKGQRTIDHAIFDALREKKNVADLTCTEWRKSLEEE